MFSPSLVLISFTPPSSKGRRRIVSVQLYFYVPKQRIFFSSLFVNCFMHPSSPPTRALKGETGDGKIVKITNTSFIRIWEGFVRNKFSFNV